MVLNAESIIIFILDRINSSLASIHIIKYYNLGWGRLSPAAPALRKWGQGWWESEACLTYTNPVSRDERKEKMGHACWHTLVTQCAEGTGNCVLYVNLSYRKF